MKPIAFVIPWYGETLKGGAEQFAWQFTHRLAARGHPVEVLATCCVSFLEDWNTNHLDPGEELLEDNLLVRRFEVRERDAHSFHRANQALLAIPTEQLGNSRQGDLPALAETFVRENIRSGQLAEFIEKNRDDYHAFVFIPYMYGLTFDCLPLVADKAYLHPCLHDEVYAFMPQVEQMFRQAGGILYNSRGERSLAESLFGPGIFNKGVVVGGGVESGAVGQLEHLGVLAGVDLEKQRYFLFLGRRDATKNTTLLVDAFRKFSLLNEVTDVSLYLAGPGSQSFADDTCNIKDFGLVSEIEKESLLKNCLALLQPSSNESYSRSVMEAWLYGKPVGVHSDCQATAEPVEESGGGWIADSEAEWIELIRSISNVATEELNARGVRGREYAQQYASWETAIDRYEQALGIESSDEPTSGSGTSRPFRKIIQLTAGITYGDAISNQAIFVRDYLRAQGYQSDIYVEVLDPACAGEAEVFNKKYLADADALIYHHSIGSTLSAGCMGFAGPKALIYHNITPAKYYAPYNNEVAALLEAGRLELVDCVKSFPCAYGDSCFNADELRELGARDTGVLPIAVDPAMWMQEPCPVVLNSIADGKRNILFVGRISPNKCQEQLLLAFNHYRVLDPESRLILVGGYDVEDRYYRQLQRTIQVLGLVNDVVVTGKVSQRELHAYYKASHLFWSMSEHEGFGVPLVESMWFELPVMAYKSSAVPETLAQGGILFDDKADLQLLSFLASRLLRDKKLRAQIIAGQRERRLDFHPEQVKITFDQLIENLGRQSK